MDFVVQHATMNFCAIVQLPLLVPANNRSEGLIVQFPGSRSFLQVRFFPVFRQEVDEVPLPQRKTTTNFSIKGSLALLTCSNPPNSSFYLILNPKNLYQLNLCCHGCLCNARSGPKVRLLVNFLSNVS